MILGHGAPFTRQQSDSGQSHEPKDSLTYLAGHADQVLKEEGKCLEKCHRLSAAWLARGDFGP